MARLPCGLKLIDSVGVSVAAWREFFVEAAEEDEEADDDDTAAPPKCR